MTELETQIVSSARAALGPQVKTLRCRYEDCIMCRRSMADTPVGERLFLWTGKETALGGVICQPCWHALIDAHPNDVKLEPFKPIEERRR